MITLMKQLTTNRHFGVPRAVAVGLVPLVPCHQTTQHR
jgi:hypothetical protein